MCSVSGLRALLCHVVFQPAGPRFRAGLGRRPGVGRDGGSKPEQPGLSLVKWLSGPLEGAESCSLKALQLLSELLEVRWPRWDTLVQRFSDSFDFEVFLSSPSTSY